MSAELQPPSSGTDRLKALVQASLRYAGARAQLLQIEAQEASVHLRSVIIGALFLAGTLAAAWLLIIPALIFLLASTFQISWIYLSLSLAALHLIAAGIVMKTLLKRLGSTRLFEESLNQFQTDRTWLAGPPQK
jgi:hypothetical protein